MPSCERCWRDSRMQELTGSGPTYQELLAERGPDGCTPEQQAGPDARVCATCGRRAIHQHVTDWCMACNTKREAVACAECERHEHGTPDHNGSRACRSGSIASGGTRAHCTCDVCY